MPGPYARENFTFFVVADTHYGTDPVADATTSRLVDQMNGLPGTPWPAPLGGHVDPPRGIVHLGDITNDGRAESLRTYWADYGGTGQDGRLRFPVFEVWGNHDGGPRQPVQLAIIERNRQRESEAVRVSSNGLFCSWDWGGIHFVALGIFPGTSQKTYDPQGSLPFLVAGLARHVGSSGRPVILLHHFGFDRHSVGWWSNEFWVAYREAIRPYNVAAIFHGHAHETLGYEWEGIPVFSPPHLRRSRPGTEPLFTHGFFAVRVNGSEMFVVERRVDGTWGRTFCAKIRWPAAERTPPSAQQALFSSHGLLVTQNLTPAASVPVRVSIHGRRCAVAAIP